MIFSTSCQSDITVIKPIKPDCVNSIKTNGDMAECLIKYMEVLNEGDLSGSR